jgi:hypothetical protein
MTCSPPVRFVGKIIRAAVGKDLFRYERGQPACRRSAGDQQRYG